ncbi:hypothetical protein POF50_006485 [Streptomyces sp. SL13]|uniref:Uncharacterized protein n=1 Tax=Streptantibioticus silvisoli TaxID=2705255 RepID=A0AA90GW82_9ACTN|nr:ETEC_3214 domain-containing protein [Streptantibioticus silvisoli]MDI5964348.1 hypothetical protein [Streptantibioticus silvisoli]MDI5968994.1 hypothetical protein [Streptantibioticus silvisoli]
MEWLSGLVSAMRFVPLVLASAGLFVLIRSSWRAGVGRGRYLAVNLRRLAPFVRPEYVTGLFGEHAWQETVPVRLVAEGGSEVFTGPYEAAGSLIRRTWALGRMGYLTTWSTDDSVWMYSVTTRSRWFRPRLDIGPAGFPRARSIRLGSTRIGSFEVPQDGYGFGEVLGGDRAPGTPPDDFAYAELHEFRFQSGIDLAYAVGVSTSGFPVHRQLVRHLRDRGEPGWAEYRRAAVINSVLVLGSTPLVRSSVLPEGIGPSRYLVRHLDTPPSRRTVRRRRRAFRRHEHAAAYREIARREKRNEW